MNFLPININIEGAKIVIVGGGRVGLHKAQILSRFTDSATVISPSFRSGFEALPFTLVNKEYDPSDLDGALLVYACTEVPTLNEQILADAHARGILCSVCDAPRLCDFTSPAIFRPGKGDVLVAVSSNARDVRRSMSIRDSIQRNWETIEASATEAERVY